MRAMSKITETSPSPQCRDKRAAMTARPDTYAQHAKFICNRERRHTFYWHAGMSREGTQFLSSGPWQKKQERARPLPRSTNDRSPAARALPAAVVSTQRMKEDDMTMMKRLMIGAALAAILGTSALAQSFDPAVGSGNIVPDTNYAPSAPVASEPYLGSASGPYAGPSRARAYAPESRGLSARSYAYQPRHHLHLHTMQGHSDMDRE